MGIPLIALSIGFFIFAVLGYHFKVTSQPLAAESVNIYGATVVSVMLAGLSMLFAPGIMTIDSIMQWDQAQGLVRIDNWHPAFSTILLRGFYWACGTPACVTMAQCVLLVVVFFLGQRALIAHNAGWGSVAASWIIALTSPVILVIAVTLWKDVWYGLAVLAMTVLLVSVFRTEGRCLRDWRYVVALALVGAVIMLLRHNGIPVPFITIAVLLVAFPWLWKRLIAVVAMTLLVFGLVRGPVFSLFDVSDWSLSHTLYAHHIAAHLDAGTELTDSERAFLDRIRPIENGWEYDCSSVNPTVFDEAYDMEVAFENRMDMALLAAKLAFRHPVAELRHIDCVGAMVWQLLPRGAATFYGFHRNGEDLVYIHEDAARDPVVPLESRLRGKIPDQLRKAVYLASSLWIPQLLTRPATWLYLLCLGVGVYAWRNRSWRVVVIVTPVLAHSMILAIVNIAPDERYQYSVFLVTALLAPWLLSTRTQASRRTRGETNAQSDEPEPLASDA
jgi:hypothetical protein